jgi:hypothetical protein
MRANRIAALGILGCANFHITNLRTSLRRRLTRKNKIPGYLGNELQEASKKVFGGSPLGACRTQTDLGAEKLETAGAFPMADGNSI